MTEIHSVIERPLQVPGSPGDSHLVQEVLGQPMAGVDSTLVVTREGPLPFLQMCVSHKHHGHTSEDSFGVCGQEHLLNPTSVKPCNHATYSTLKAS